MLCHSPDDAIPCMAPKVQRMVGLIEGHGVFSLLAVLIVSLDWLGLEIHFSYVRLDNIGNITPYNSNMILVAS